MNGVLLKLYWLTIKGAFRSLGRRFQTVRGALLSLVSLGFVTAMIANAIFMLVMRAPHSRRESIRRAREFVAVRDAALFPHFYIAVTWRKSDSVFG